MPITQRFLSLDGYYRQTPGDKIIINDLNHFSMQDIETLNNSLMTVYNNSDILSTVPSCDCGNLKGRFRKKQLCSNCGTNVHEIHEKVKPLLWLKAINQNLQFLNPDFWLIMRTMLDKNIDYLRWMCDPKYNPPVELPNWIYGVKEILGNVRDYQNTMNKIPEILQYLMNHAKFKEHDKQINLKLLYDMFITHRHELFSEHLPIINKKLFVMENTTKGRFINLAVSEVVDVVMMWVKAVNDEKPSPKKNSTSTAVAISKLAELYHTYFENYVVQKIGIFRKHVYGARSHFTFRSVITSIPGQHQHDEIHIPWSIGVTVFRPHILNKLISKGVHFKEANKLLYKSVKKYIPEIDDIFQEMLNESRTPGKIPCIAQRN